MVTLAKNWATVGPQHQCVHPILTEPRLVSFQALLLLSLIDVSGTLFEAGARPSCSHTPLTRIPCTCQTCRDIGNKLVFSKSVDACWGRPEFVSCLEHVQVRLSLSHNQRGKLAIHLISPLGTRSTLLFPRYIVNRTIKISVCLCVCPCVHACLWSLCAAPEEMM